jgi:hypothetical protein
VTIVSRTLIGLVSLALLACPLEARGGVLITEKRTTSAEGSGQTHHVQIDRDWMRMEYQMAGDKQAIVFDAAKQVAWTINYDKKTYVEMTKADLERVNAQSAEVMVKAQEAMKNMNPQQRAMMEAMLKAQKSQAQRPVYRKVGTDQVGRWTCDKYEGYLNDQKISELCTVDPTVLGLAEADFEVTRKVAEFVKRLVPRNADSLVSLGKSEDQGFSGVPVRRMVSMGRRQLTTEVTDVSRQTFPPSTWEIPAGFTKQTYGQPAPSSQGSQGGQHKH